MTNIVGGNAGKMPHFDLGPDGVATNGSSKNKNADFFQLISVLRDGRSGIEGQQANGERPYQASLVGSSQDEELVNLEVTPNDKIGGQNLNANITINAIDAAGVEEVLTQQRGNIIGMIREAAHEHGEEFIESVGTSSYGGGPGG